MTAPADTGFADEIALQYALVRRDLLPRLGFNNLCLALTTLYVPVWMAVTASLINLVCELGTLDAMERLRRQDQRWRYRVLLGLSFLMEFSFMLVPAVIWQQEDNLAKPFAIGVVMMNLLHLGTERGIHLPLGLTMLAGTLLTVGGGNAVYWIGLGDMTGLLVSSICVMGGIGYTVTVMQTTSSLHRETAAASRKAQSSEEAQTRFLAQMSHELRTPLNAILGMGRTELARSTDPLTHERLSLLVFSAEGLQVILDDALDFSAIQQRRLTLRPKPGAPAQTIRAATDLFAEEMARGGQSLELTMTPELDDLALFDAHRLHQCLSNLLSNVVKYAGPGNVHLRARLVKRIDAVPLLRIEIADEGPGISASRANHIFDPYSGGVGLQPGQESGLLRSTGLGLAISRALARQMGGNLVLAPISKQGARFILTLELPPTPDRLVPSLHLNQQLSGLRVLVVDDILSNRLVASAYLQGLGMLVELAASGAEALAMIDQNRPDVVMLDLQMPEMSGAETLARLRRATATGRHLPVIAMTAWAKFPKLPGNERGVDGTVPKPLDPVQLRDELSAVLGRAHAAHPDPTTDLD